MKKLIGFVLCVWSFMCMGGESYVGKDAFHKVKTGMSYSEVVDTLGSEGKRDTRTVYVWKEAHVQVDWEGDTLVTLQTVGVPSKDEKNGFEMLNKARTDPDHPKEPPRNLTYAQVVKLLGQEGTKPDWVRYVWQATKYKKLWLTFKHDKLTEKLLF